MNWTILVVFAIISGLALWLGAKFFGKKGMIYVVALQVALCLTLYSANAGIFGVFVSCILIFMLTTLFVAFLFYKKYTIKDTIKFLVLTGGAVVVIGLTNSIVELYASGLNFAWSFGLLPMLTFLASLGVAIVVGYVVDTQAKFIKDYTLRNFTSLGLAVLSLIIVNNLFALTGVVSFGNFLLSILISFIVAVIYLLVLIALEKLGLLIKKNEVITPVVVSKHKSTKKEITLDDNQK